MEDTAENEPTRDCLEILAKPPTSESFGSRSFGVEHMANAGSGWIYYVLENSENMRYVGISEDVAARISSHRNNVRGHLGKGQHRLIRSGEIKSKANATKFQRLQHAARVELLELVREMSAATNREQRDKIRGGPFPGKILPREWPEITEWCRLFQEGEDKMKEKMVELQLGEGEPPPFWKGSASLEHLQVRCWRCQEVGHFSGNCSTGKAPLGKVKEDADALLEAKLQKVEEDLQVLAELKKKAQAVEAEKTRKRQAAEKAVKEQLQQAKKAKLEAKAAEEAARRLPSKKELEEEERFLRRLHERFDAMPKVQDAPVKPHPKRHYSERGSSTNASKAAQRKLYHQNEEEKKKKKRAEEKAERQKKKEEKSARARAGQKRWARAAGQQS